MISRSNSPLASLASFIFHFCKISFKTLLIKYQELYQQYRDYLIAKSPRLALLTFNSIPLESEASELAIFECDTT